MRVIKVDVNIGKGWMLRLEKLDFDGDFKPTGQERKKLEDEIRSVVPHLFNPIEINFLEE